MEVERLFRHLGDLQSVTKELQSEDFGLCLERVLFDGVIENTHKPVPTSDPSLDLSKILPSREANANCKMVRSMLQLVQNEKIYCIFVFPR